jgi:hypothetical protein
MTEPSWVGLGLTPLAPATSGDPLLPPEFELTPSNGPSAAAVEDLEVAASPQAIS